MKLRHLALVAVTAIPLLARAQQSPEVAAQLATADFIRAHVNTVSYLHGKQIVVDSAQLSFVVAGNHLVPVQAPQLLLSIAEIADHLHGRVAMDSDGVRCGAPSCRPIGIVRVRMGPASVAGDSAAVPYLLGLVLGEGRTARPLSDRYVALLKESGGKWRVVAFSAASGGMLSVARNVARSGN